MTKVKNNKITYRNYQNFVIEDRNCEEVHVKIDSMRYKGGELTVEEREILEEVRREEEEKRKEAEDAAKKRKKGKGKKKKVEEDD